MKFFFSVFTDKGTGKFRRASFSDEEPVTQTRHIKDREAVSVEIEVDREPRDFLAELSSQEKIRELLARALLALPREERERIARETGVSIHSD